MSELDAAKADYKKKDKRYHLLLNAFFAYVVVLLTFVAIQTLVTQTTIARNQKSNAIASEERFKRYTEDNAIQHRKTQQYIRCIAQVLLQPIDRRTDAAFDNCSVNGLYEGKTSGAVSKATQNINSVAAVPTVNNRAITVINHPTTTSAPPDPETPTPPADTTTDTTLLQGLPLVGGLFKYLGL